MSSVAAPVMLVVTPAAVVNPKLPLGARMPAPPAAFASARTVPPDHSNAPPAIVMSPWP
jgi:hypothetical protein